MLSAQIQCKDTASRAESQPREGCPEGYAPAVELVT